VSAGSWDAMLAAEDAARFSSQAGLASIQTREANELQRRRVLARLSKPELINAVIAAEGLVTDVPTNHEIRRHDA